MVIAKLLYVFGLNEEIEFSKKQSTFFYGNCKIDLIDSFNIFQSQLVIKEISFEYPTSDMCASYLRKTHYDSKLYYISVNLATAYRCVSRQTINAPLVSAQLNYF